MKKGDIVIQGSFPGGKPFQSVLIPAKPPVNQHIENRNNNKHASVNQSSSKGNINSYRLDSSRLNLTGDGFPLPCYVLQKMDLIFNKDFSNVRVHTAGHQAESIGALAFTTGNDIYFAQGRYNPLSPDGERLLAHELTHVIQQKTRRVFNPFAGGVSVVQDPGLEAEAERMAIKTTTVLQRKCNCGVSCPCRKKKKNTSCKFFNRNSTKNENCPILQRMIEPKYNFRHPVKRYSPYHKKTHYMKTRRQEEEESMGKVDVGVKEKREKDVCRYGRMPDAKNWSDKLWNGFKRPGWKEGIKEKLIPTGTLCSVCHKNLAVTLDHITPFKEHALNRDQITFCDNVCHYRGYSLQDIIDSYNDEENLQPICKSCNSIKASGEKTSLNAPDPPVVIGRCPSHCPECMADVCL